MLIRRLIAIKVALTVLLSACPAHGQTNETPDAVLGRREILAVAMARDFPRLERTSVALQLRFEQSPTRASEEQVVRFFLAFASTRVGLGKRLKDWREQMPRSYAAQVASGTHEMQLASLARERSHTHGAPTEAPHTARAHVERARKYFEAAVALNDRISRAWSQQIEIAVEMSDHNRRDVVAARALGRLPQSLEIRTAYLLALQPSNGGSMAAVDRFLASSRRVLSPQDFALLDAQRDIVAGDDLLRQGRDFDACQHYDRAVRAGEQWRALLGRGMCQRRLGRSDLALRDVSRALELRPESTTMLAERALIYRAAGEPEAALGDLNTALELDPRNRELLHARAWLLLAHMHRADEALTDARKLVRLAPRSSDAWQTYGAVLLWGKNDSAAAGRVFGRAVSLGPNDTNAWFGYGQALYNARSNESLDAFETYAGLCARGARCDESDQAWLRRFIHNPFTYAQWPRILFKWRLLSELL